jgi:hypothetical protein
MHIHLFGSYFFAFVSALVFQCYIFDFVASQHVGECAI